MAFFTRINFSRFKIQISEAVFIFFYSLLVVPSTNLVAQVSDPIRPSVGLALSGGGAKGLAHIGVLKVLEEAGRHFNKT